MSRVQLSINVSDLAAAVDFYSRLFGTAPAKLRPGYANFAIDDPPLKLVLNSPGNGPGGTTNHLGVEVDTAWDVTHAEARLAGLRRRRRLTQPWASGRAGSACPACVLLVQDRFRPVCAAAAEGREGMLGRWSSLG